MIAHRVWESLDVAGSVLVRLCFVFQWGVGWDGRPFC